MRTRYEVRNAKGRLCGLFSVDLEGRAEIRLNYTPPLKMGGILGDSALTGSETRLKMYTVTLQLNFDFTNRGVPMPTLVISQGKQAWLKGYPGFTRV